MASPHRSEVLPSPSLLSTILPVAVHTRLPQLRSFRRSWSGYTFPESQYVSHDGRYNRVEAEDRQHRQDGTSSPAGSKNPSAKSRSLVQSRPVRDNGIAWKYTNQGTPKLPIFKRTQLMKSIGLGLLETAIAEAELSDPRSQAFSRQLYIHALAYLIQALPADLSKAETVCIDEALPYGLRRHTQVSPSHSRTHHHPRSFLHRILASTIIQLFVLCQLVLPYVRHFLRKAYRYERTHQISEKILEIGVNAGERIARLWCDIFYVISQIPDKKLVAMLVGMLLWWVQGISGGIHEGIGEGMSIIGVTKADLFS